MLLPAINSPQMSMLDSKNKDRKLYNRFRLRGSFKDYLNPTEEVRDRFSIIFRLILRNNVYCAENFDKRRLVNSKWYKNSIFPKKIACQIQKYLN